MEGKHKFKDNKNKSIYIQDNVAQNHRWIEQNAKSQDMPESSRISFGCLSAPRNDELFSEQIMTESAADGFGQQTNSNHTKAPSLSVAWRPGCQKT